MSTIVLAASTNPFIPADYDIIWSLVPFAVIVAFFWFFAIPRFRAILDDRAAVIEGGIAKAEHAQAAAAAQLEKYNEMLAEARAEAASIREQARVDGTQILRELKEHAAAEAARITSTASAQIEAERQNALLSLRAEVGSLAIDLASGVVGQSLADDKNASRLVDSFLADLDASGAAGVSGKVGATGKAST